MASFYLPLRSYEMLWLIMCGLSMTSTGQHCQIGSSEVRVFATIHDDNSSSENSQPDPVETGSNVTLTCHGAQKSEIDWYFNSTFLEVPKCKNVKTCNLTLRWPVARGNYTCYVNYGGNCFLKVLELKVVDGEDI